MNPADAGNIAIGTVLYFGNATVEDACWLRKINDKRPIDRVARSYTKRNDKLVIPFMRSLGVHRKETRKNVHIFSDNRPVLGMLTRKQSNYWTSS